MGQAQWAVLPIFFRGPISWTIVAILVIATLYPLFAMVRKRRQTAAKAGSDE